MSDKLAATMIEITPAAAHHLQQKIQQEKGEALCLSMKPYGCNGYGYTLEVLKTREGLPAPSSQSLVACYVEAHYAEALTGLRIDYIQKGLGQRQLVFQNPQVESACGCGESVKMKNKKAYDV